MNNILLIAIMVLLTQTGLTKEAVQNISLAVTENGFEPSAIKVKSGVHVILKVTRKTDTTCATQIVFKEKKIKTDLPLNKEVSVDLGILKKADISFACGMDMLKGKVLVQ